MTRGSNASKRSEWAERMQRYAKSDQTVSEFCRSESVSLPSFYQWRRKLRTNGRGREASEGKRSRHFGDSSAFHPIRLSVGNVVGGASVRLPNGIVIELGTNPAVVETIVAQLLSHAVASGAKPC
jgi:transposase-like protein